MDNKQKQKELQRIQKAADYVMDRISQQRTKLLGRLPFFGRLALKLRPRLERPGEGVSTACVTQDGTLVVNAEFAKPLTDPQLAFVIAHEVLHPAMLYFDRMQSRIPQLWNCFPAGTLVGGDYAPIESLDSGDRVLTQSGMAKVVEPMSRHYKGPLFDIRAMGLEPFSTTNEHPLLVVRRLNKSYPIKLSTPYFETAENIEPKVHYLVVPRVKPANGVRKVDLDPYTKSGRWGAEDLGHNRRLKDGLPLNLDTAWMLGLYTAEGHTDSNGVRWTLGNHRIKDRERLSSIITNLGLSPCRIAIPERNADRIICGSPILARMFSDHFGKTAHLKKISDTILYNENEGLLKSFLEGYVAGDGHAVGLHKDGIGSSTASRKLALQTQLAHARLGRFGKVYKTIQKDRYIRDEFIKGGKPLWKVESHAGRKSTRQMPWGAMESESSRWKLADDFIFTPVKSVEPYEFDGNVFNIETPDNTYTVNNAVVHNCAHDHAINLIIKQMADVNIELLPDVLCDTKYTDWSAEEIYDELLKDAVLLNIIQGACPTCGNDGTPGDQGDQQGQQSDQQEQQGGQQGQGSCPTCNGKGGAGGKGQGFGQGNDPRKDPLFGDVRNDLNDSADGKKAANGDKAAKNRIDTDWKISIVAASQAHEQQKGRGSLPGSLQRLIDEITDPKVDWREQLSRWVGENGRLQDYTFGRPSRRSESVGQYMPSLKKYGFAPVCVMVDTSGSIGRKMLQEGLSEIQGVCEDLGIGVRAVVCDATVHDDVEVEDAYELAEHLSGGGGSNFRPAFDKLQEEGYDGVVIAFTDGDICVPAVKPENLRGVLWCIYDGCHSPTDSYGETICIPREVA